MPQVRLVKTFTGYLYVEGECSDLIKILKHLRDRYGRRTADVDDAIRILSNFSVFYDMMRRKFKDFIAPRKDEADLIKGLVTVDKVKLIKEGGKDLGVIVFDKRIESKLLLNAMKELGIEVNIVEQ